MSNLDSHDDDIRMVRQSLEGDALASRYLFDKYRDRVFRIAYRYLGNREDAMDALQQAFINAFASLSSFTGQSSFYTWLARIAVNSSIDLRRKRGRRAEKTRDQEALELGRLPKRQSESTPEELVERNELEEALGNAIEELPELQKAVVVLHTHEQMSYKEIAEILGCSIGTVMSRLFYARKKLQKKLADYL